MPFYWLYRHCEIFIVSRGDLRPEHIVCAVFILYFPSNFLSRCPVKYYRNVTSDASSDVSSDACKQTVNNDDDDATPPAVFDLSWTHMSSQPAGWAGFSHRQPSLSLGHSSSRCHPLVAPLIHASLQLLFVYPPPLVLGARFTVEKYSTFFSPHVELVSVECVFGLGFCEECEKTTEL